VLLPASAVGGALLLVLADLRSMQERYEEAEAIYRLTSLCTFEDRFVIPPMHREEAVQMMMDPLEHKQSVGFGFMTGPRRGM